VHGLAEDTYVRVYGRIRTFDNQPSLIAYNIRAVTTSKEIDAHKVEVKLARLFWEQVVRFTLF
jgi:hypothetical protein